MISSAVRERIGACGCEVRWDDLTRVLYATDASLYQLMPEGVAFPRSAAEAAAVIRAAADAGVPVTPRGAGTGLAGGAIGTGLIVDFARHGRGIRDLDLEARTVRVGPGVVLDELNAWLRPYGLWFGPDVATSSRATLGGMIANDSSGARVPAYGTTVDHVVSLEVVLADGTVAEVGAGLDGLPAQRAEADALAERYGSAINAAHPEMGGRRLKRRPGYGFGKYRQGRGDLTRLIAGSEGTLAGITSARLGLVPLPKRRGLGLIFFASVEDAMQATVELLDLEPVAIEHIDRILFDRTRGQLAFAAARSMLQLDEDPAESILIVEFFDEVDGRLAALESRKLGLRKLIVKDDAGQALVWGLRKAGLALLTGLKGPGKPTTGIEDAAVLPEQLPAYVAGLRSILDLLGVEASFYGHAASGLLHVRPVLDLHTAEGVADLRRVADEVSALVRQFRGSIAGEHGVGIARTEYLPAHLGPELMSAHAAIKRAFDPRWLMNPGKVVPAGQGEAYRIDTHLRQGAAYTLRLPVEGALGFVERDGSFVANLEQCNGAGVCLKRVPAMCPTHIATGEEIMSTRGRANTIRALLDGRLARGEQALLAKELEEALGPCLSCKACKSECPSNVDLALLKAELLFARHRLRGVPWLDRLIASADRLGRIGSATAPISNGLLRSRLVRRIMEAVLGIARQRTLPAYASERFDRWFDRHGDELVREAAERHASAGAHDVVLWDDTWVRYHEPHIGVAAVKVLAALGHRVTLARGRACCGRPAFSRGLLDEALRLGRHNVGLLTRAYAGLPVVFLEPSCHAMFVDEYRQLGISGAEDLARRCFSFEQFVEQRLAGAAASPFDADGAARPATMRVAIHAHCHARALTDVSLLPKLARRLPGAEVELLDTGCCGMAGAFGITRDHYALSQQVAQPLIDRIRSLPPGTAVIASGTSCRHQMEELAGVRPWHMAELLARRLPSG